MSLTDVKRKTSSSEFVLWMEYLEWEINAFDKTCFYLAQIAAEVRRPYMPKGRNVKLSDFIMKFHRRGEERETDKGVSLQRAKNFFFGLTGLVGGARKKKGK